MPSKDPVHQRPARKHRKGKLPVKGRESILKRLKQYQAELAFQRGQPTAEHEEPEAIERKK